MMGALWPTEEHVTHRRRRTKGRSAPAFAVATGLIIFLGLATASCGNGGLPEPVTSQGDFVVKQWQIFLWGAVAVSALIWFLVAYAIITSIRRRRAEDADGPDGDIPPQTQYRTKLEIVYTAIPLVLVIGLFSLAMYGTNILNDSGAKPDLTVNVVGFQWQWQFNYEAQNVTVGGSTNVLPDLYLPVGAVVRFNLKADDVIHSFWVPDFLEKKDLIPGIDTNQITVKVTRAGTYVGRCAEYCGLNHWQMKFNVYAVPQDQFDDWIRKQPKGRPFVKGTFTTEAGVPTTTTTVAPFTTGTTR